MAKIAISISGGGLLGIGPLQFMCRLEQDLGKKLTNQSIAFAGTSTGAIIAACLAEGMSAHDIFDLYKNNLKKIFTKYPWYKRALSTCPTYDNSNLKKMLQDNLKGKMKDWVKPVFITSTFTNGDSQEKVFDNTDKDMKWKAVLASTAAPTYFDPVYFDNICAIDGGMWSNDPTMCLQAGLKNQGFKSKYKILTFNTGMDTPNEATGNKTLVGWGAYLLEEWIARSGKSNYFEACANLGKENVFRASPSIDKKIKMDDVSDKTIQKVINIWDKYYDSVRSKVLAFINE
jgi:patatin-like phospholipase/acyl hydrolase